MQDAGGRPHLAAAVPFGSPAYRTGLERDDIILSIGGTAVANAADVERRIRERRPGESVAIAFERRGQRVNGTLRLVADPRLDLLPAEAIGRPLTGAQERFRDGWLRSAAGNAS